MVVLVRLYRQLRRSDPVQKQNLLRPLLWGLGLSRRCCRTSELQYWPLSRYVQWYIGSNRTIPRHQHGDNLKKKSTEKPTRQCTPIEKTKENFTNMSITILGANMCSGKVSVFLLDMRHSSCKSLSNKRRFCPHKYSCVCSSNNYNRWRIPLISILQWSSRTRNYNIFRWDCDANNKIYPWYSSTCISQTPLFWVWPLGSVIGRGNLGSRNII